MRTEFSENLLDSDGVSRESEKTDELGVPDVNACVNPRVGDDGIELGFQESSSLENGTEFSEEQMESTESGAAAADGIEAEATRKKTLNFTADMERGDDVAKLGFKGILNLEGGSDFPEKLSENNQSAANLRERERDDDDEREGSSSKRMRFSIEEKGKRKLMDDDNASAVKTSHKKFDALLILATLCMDLYGKIEKEEMEGRIQERKEREEDERLEREKKHIHETTIGFADEAHGEPATYYNSIQLNHKPKKEKMVKDPIMKLKDMQGGFLDALQMIKKRNSKSDPLEESFLKQEFLAPIKKGPKRHFPSLLDLSLKTLGKYVGALVSLENIPDELRHKLADVVSDLGKLDVQFVELLTRDSQTWIRLKNCSQLTEQDFTKILSGCDPSKLTVLQLSLCGKGMTAFMLHDIFSQIPHGFPRLTTISLRGAFRLTDFGLSLLSANTPLLQSIDLSQCSLLTSSAVQILSKDSRSNLQELYLEDCQNINPVCVLHELAAFTCLKVLSVAGIESVNDDFVASFVTFSGANLEELFLANCKELSNDSVDYIGRCCPKLKALDLSYLPKLTDSALQRLANGCKSIRKLRFCRNSFSDDAVAAFLEVSGNALNELSLNNIRNVGKNTVISLVKFLKDLRILDLSWCRKLAEEHLRLILHLCPSLRHLKLFGCMKITKVFVNAYSNSHVQIVGLDATSILDHLGDPEPQ